MLGGFKAAQPRAATDTPRCASRAAERGRQSFRLLLCYLKMLSLKKLLYANHLCNHLGKFLSLNHGTLS